MTCVEDVYYSVTRYIHSWDSDVVDDGFLNAVEIC